MRRSSRIAAGVSCTLCEDSITFSDAAPGRCALWNGTTPSLESSSARLGVLFAMIEWYCTSAAIGMVSASRRNRLWSLRFSMLFGTRSAAMPG